MRALLIERMAMVRDIFAQYLQMTTPDCFVEPVRSISDGIEQLRDDTPFDIIIADMHSTSSRGFDDIEALQANADGVPIILLCNTETVPQMLDAYRRGIAGFVPKTVPGRILPLAVQMVLCGERFVPSTFLSAVDSQLTPSAMMEEADDERLRLLTRRERTVLSALMEGYSNLEISIRLGITENTVRLHVSGVLKKLGVKNRVQAARLASKLNVRSFTSATTRAETDRNDEAEDRRS